MKIETGNLIEELKTVILDPRYLKTAIVFEIKKFTQTADKEYKLIWSDDTVSYSGGSFVQSMISCGYWRIHQ